MNISLACCNYDLLCDSSLIFFFDLMDSVPVNITFVASVFTPNLKTKTIRETMSMPPCDCSITPTCATEALAARTMIDDNRTIRSAIRATIMCEWIEVVASKSMAERGFCDSLALPA